MVTTNNPIFNALMDSVLSPNDRRLMLVTPKTENKNVHSIGLITFSEESIAMYERNLKDDEAKVEALKQLIALCKIGKILNVETLETDT